MQSIALSPAIQEQIAEAQQELARRRLKHFCLRMNPRLRLQPYHDLIFDGLEALERGEITRLVIEAPPRHSKTEIVSRKFVAWLLGRNPDAQVILSSYGTDLARNASRDARNLFAEPLWPFPSVEIAKDASSAEEWATVKGGKVKAAGVGAGITGYGADCVPGDTLIQTEIGAMTIQHLVHLSYKPRVLSYDHATNTLVWRRIVATREVDASELIEIRTRDGRILRSTRDHRIFTPTKGYRSAGVLECGDPVVALGRDSLRQVRTGGNRRCHGLSPVLPSPESGLHRDRLLALRQAVRQDALRLQQGHSTEEDTELLLLTRMRQVRPQRDAAARLQDLRQAKAQANQLLLLERMQGGRAPVVAASATTQPQALLELSGRVSTEFQSIQVLRDGVQERGPFESYGRPKKLALQDRYQLRQVVQVHARANLGSRRASLRRVRWPGNEVLLSAQGQNVYAIHTADPPHRRNPVKQCAREFGHALQDLSYRPPQVSDDSVAMVRHVRTGPVRVYDIQVEGTHNFFANEVLVHNCLIVDDPFKGAEDAFSKTAREKVWDWYVNEARTRLMPGGRIILICTRWHQDDLIGRALAEAKENGRESEWRVLRLPAIAEANDPVGRQVGEALDPDRYPVSYLKQFMGISRTWNALYQQNPIPDSGSIFLKDWWLYYDPEQLERQGLKAKYIYVDPAFGGNAKNDETAATVWGTLGGKLYWMDTFHERVPYHELKKKLGHFYAKWHVPLIIEDNGWSQILVNELRSPTPSEDGAISFPVIPYKLPGGNRSKTERAIAVKTATAESVTAMVEGGMVFLPQGASWLDYAVGQLTEFPAAKHDDVVDSVVMALTHMGVEHSEAINHFYFQTVPVVHR